MKRSERNDKEHFHAGSGTREIVVIIAEMRGRANREKILTLLESRGFTLQPFSITVTLTDLKKRGMITHSRENCDCCGRLTTTYSITEKGLMHVAAS